MSEKSHFCKTCRRRFGSKHSLRQHQRDSQCRLADDPAIGKEGAMAVLDDFGGDLPDGAFFALAADLGLEPEDFARKKGSSP